MIKKSIVTALVLLIAYHFLFPHFREIFSTERTTTRKLLSSTALRV